MKPGESRRVGALPVLVAAASLVLAPLARVEAAEGQTGETRNPSLGGMTISIDPETGRLRPPSAEEIEKLRAGLREMLAKMRQRRRAQPTTAAGPGATVGDPTGRTVQLPREDRTLSVLVGTEHLNFTVATVGPDGRVAAGCVNGAHDHREAESEGPSED